MHNQNALLSECQTANDRDTCKPPSKLGQNGKQGGHFV